MATRRSFSPEFKVQVVLELLSGAKTNAEVCRGHQLAPAVVSAWKEQFLERAPEVFATSKSNGLEHERIAELERLAGRLALELEVAKKSIQLLDLRVEEKRQVIAMLSGSYPVSLACEVLGCSRSSYYYRGHVRDESELKATVEEIATTWPTYGSRRITAELRRQGWQINRKHVSHLLVEMNLQIKKRRKTKTSTNSNHPYPRYPNLVQDLEIVHPDQVWVADITYVGLLTEYVYLAVIMDVFTRCIRGWHLGRGLDQELSLTALRRALSDHRPVIHHSDQGVQYAATAYVEMLEGHGILVSMAAVGAAWQNGYAERLIRTIKEEAVYLSEYRDYEDAHQQIGRFLDDVYMHKRIHSALGYLTPSEYEHRWRTARQFHDKGWR